MTTAVVDTPNGTTTALVRAEPSAAPARATLLRPIARPAEMLEAIKDVHEHIRSTLQEGHDYGVIPGTKNKVLLKPGAEKLTIAFGLEARFTILDEERDHDRVNVFVTPWIETDEKPGKAEAEALKAKKLGRWKKTDSGEFVWMVKGEGQGKSFGLYRFMVRCDLLLPDGTVKGTCIASCSTLESKYIDRPRDCENTVLKMAQKRARVGAVVDALGLSDAFTVDIEDDRVVDGEVVAKDPREDSKPNASAPPAKSKPVDTSVKPATRARALALMKDLGIEKGAREYVEQINGGPIQTEGEAQAVNDELERRVAAVHAQRAAAEHAQTEITGTQPTTTNHDPAVDGDR